MWHGSAAAPTFGAGSAASDSGEGPEGIALGAPPAETGAATVWGGGEGSRDEQARLVLRPMPAHRSDIAFELGNHRVVAIKRNNKHMSRR